MYMIKNYDFDKDIKAVICKNMKIARNLANIRLEDASEIFGVTNEHLKRIEAEHDRNNISLTLLYKATIVYNRDPNFFFDDPDKNAQLLDIK